MTNFYNQFSKYIFVILFTTFIFKNSVAQSGSHLNFDGTNDYAQCGNFLPASYTKEAWVNMSNFTLFNNLISGGESDGRHAFWIPNGYLSSGHNGLFNAVSDPTFFVANTWYHVAVTYDAPSTTMKLYKNGILISTNTSVAPYVNGNNIRIGAYEVGSPSAFFQGSIDEVRIWSGALTVAQILSRKDCKLVGNEVNLVAYYNFDQGIASANNTGLTVLTNNTATPSLDGTLTNFALSGSTSNWIGGSPVTPSIASSNLTQTLNVSTNTVFSSTCTNLITTVIPFGASPINGSTNSRVWIDPVQNLAFVKRHYEITPAINISTATAKVTLYFTQAEFDDFNAVNSLKLPVSPTDASGISRLLIEKRSGITNDGTGSPGSYTGSIQNIDPLDALVLWNPLASRWEVSFDVIGFSGFFVKSQNVVLAAKWLSVSGNVNSQKKAVINWKVSEDNVAKYYIEKSSDGRVFNEISVEQSVGNGENEYQFTEQESLKGLSYYRITQIEKGGNKFSYSPIIKLGATNNQRINIFPNPAKEFASINVSNSLLNQKIYLLSLNGKLLETLRITNTFFTINLDKLAAGVYLLKMEDGSVNKIIKY